MEKKTSTLEVIQLILEGLRTLGKHTVMLGGVVMIVLFFSFYKNKKRIKIFNELISNKLFVVSMTCIIFFSGYNFYAGEFSNANRRLLRANKHALFGFGIGMLHHFDFPSSPFWAVWIGSYYLGL